MEKQVAFKILITEPEDYSVSALATYANLGQVITLPHTGQSLEQAITDCDVLVIRLQYKLDQALLAKAARLKYIVTPTTGLDHIDETFVAKQNITIISLRGETAFLSAIPSTAEFTWALLMALVKHTGKAHQHVINGGWNRNLFKGNNLMGKKLGILGLGRVGKQVAGFAQAFGMLVSAYDTDGQQHLKGVEKCKSAEELFAWCDILSIHIPASNNDNFVSDSLLQQLKSGSYLINTSRGNVWDEAALAQLLASNRLAGIATDVLYNELNETNRINSPLLSIDSDKFNLIITPHIAGATYESMQATEDFVAERLKNLLTV